jgi:hypothetical protein
MTFNSEIKSGDQASTASPALIPCLIGCCSAGTVGGIGGHCYTFEPGANLTSTLGAGPLVDAAYALLRTTKSKVRVMPATPSWSAAPSITHTGTGPTITCALADTATGPYDDYSPLFTLTVGGALGVAQASIEYDGVNAVENVVLPTEPPAVLRGTVDLAALSYPYTALSAKHLDFTAPSAVVITFGASYASAQAIIDGFNALAIAGSLAVRARLAQHTSGLVYMELYSTSGGAGVTATIDAAASDADTLLGFSAGASNLTATGAAATLTLPWTNVKFTFPSGTYVKGDTYLAPCVGPRASVSAILTAAQAAHDDYLTNRFGFLAVVQPADTAANCQVLQAALRTKTSTWIADTNAPKYVTAVIGSQFHTASSTVATNDANIAAADADLLAAFAAAAANPDSVAPADCYVPGSADLHAGSFRRTAAVAWAIKRASATKIAADVGDGLVPEISLQGPDGKTRARDDARATTKLGRGDGPGFSVLQSTSGGLGAAKFVPGATRAGAADRLRYAGVYGICLEAARLVFAVVELWPAQTPTTNPLTGMMLDDAKEQRKNQVFGALKSTLTPDQGGGEPNVSKFTVTILDPTTGKFTDNGKTGVKVTVVPLGEIEDVSITVTAVGTTIE